MSGDGSYYEILRSFPEGCWHLGSLFDANENEVDLADLTNGKPVDVAEPLIIHQYRRGNPMDFTLAGFNVPVVYEETAKTLRIVADQDLQVISTRAAHSRQKFAILNLLTTLPCLDEARTHVLLRPPHERASKGKYESVGDIFVDPRIVQGHDLFRIQDWSIPLFCSKRVRDILEAQGGLGIEFRAA